METKLTIPADIAVSVASLASHTATRKQTAPVLEEIQVKITGTDLVALATDRVVLAEYRTTIPGQFATAPGLTHEFRLSQTAAKFILTNVKKVNKWRTPEPVEVAYFPGDFKVIITYNGLTLEDSWTIGAFPEVERLLEQWEGALEQKPVKLNTNNLARLGKLMDQFNKVNEWVFETGVYNGTNPNRSGPVKATAGNYRVLIAPMFMK